MMIVFQAARIFTTFLRNFRALQMSLSSQSDVSAVNNGYESSNCDYFRPHFGRSHISHATATD